MQFTRKKQNYMQFAHNTITRSGHPLYKQKDGLVWWIDELLHAHSNYFNSITIPTKGFTNKWEKVT